MLDPLSCLTPPSMFEEHSMAVIKWQSVSIAFLEHLRVAGYWSDMVTMRVGRLVVTVSGSTCVADMPATDLV